MTIRSIRIMAARWVAVGAGKLASFLLPAPADRGPEPRRHAATFHLSVGERDKARCWERDHERKHPKGDDGAIGGRYTYHFTPTGLGDIVQLRCACGASTTLTSFDDW